VKRELDEWLRTGTRVATRDGEQVERPPLDRLLIVLSRGTLPWQLPPDQGHEATALPRCLDHPWLTDGAHTRTQDPPRPINFLEQLESIPRWISVQEWKKAAERSPEIRRAARKLSAAIHFREEDEHNTEDLRQHNRTRWLAVSASAAIALFLVLSIVFGILQVRNRKRADTNYANALAAQAERLIDESYFGSAGVLLARARTIKSTPAIRESSNRCPNPSIRLDSVTDLPKQSRIVTLAVNESGDQILAVTKDGQAYWVSLGAGTVRTVPTGLSTEPTRAFFDADDRAYVGWFGHHVEVAHGGSEFALRKLPMVLGATSGGLILNDGGRPNLLPRSPIAALPDGSEDPANLPDLRGHNLSRVMEELTIGPETPFYPSATEDGGLVSYSLASGIVHVISVPDRSLRLSFDPAALLKNAPWPRQHPATVLSPDGNYLALQFTNADVIHFYDIEVSKARFRSETPAYGFDLLTQRVHFFDRIFVLRTSDGVITTQNVDTGRNAGMWSIGNPHAVSRETGILAFTDREGTISFCDLFWLAEPQWPTMLGGPLRIQREVLERFAAHRGTLTALVFNADGTRLFSIGEDGLLKGWRLDRRPLRTHRGIYNVRPILDGRRCMCVHYRYSTSLLSVWETDTDRLWGQSVELEDSLAPLVTAARDDLAAVLLKGGELKTYRLDFEEETISPLGTAQVAVDGVVMMEFLDGQTLVLVSRSGVATRVDLRTKSSAPASWELPDQIRECVVSNDRRSYAAVGESAIFVGDVNTGQLQRRLPIASDVLALRMYSNAVTAVLKEPGRVWLGMSDGTETWSTTTTIPLPEESQSRNPMGPFAYLGRDDACAAVVIYPNGKYGPPSVIMVDAESGESSTIALPWQFLVRNRQDPLWQALPIVGTQRVALVSLFGNVNLVDKLSSAAQVEKDVGLVSDEAGRLSLDQSSREPDREDP
jgi:WD40 repeat protein